MNDRVLLAGAARAYFDRAPKHIGEGILDWVRDCEGPWNPLESDADAFRLAVKLNLTVRYDTEPDGAVVCVEWDHHELPKTAGAGVWDYLDRHPYVATRRAIVRAAAAIGEPQ